MYSKDTKEYAIVNWRYGNCSITLMFKDGEIIGEYDL